jgi:hypothetical protein
VYARDLSVRATPAALLRRATARATDWHPPSPVLTSTVPPTPEENR